MALHTINEEGLAQAIVCLARANYRPGVELISDILTHDYSSDTRDYIFGKAMKLLDKNMKPEMVFQMYDEHGQLVDVKGSDKFQKAFMYINEILDAVDFEEIHVVNTAPMSETIGKIAFNCPTNLPYISELMSGFDMYSQALEEAKVKISESGNIQKRTDAISALNKEIQNNKLDFYIM